MLMGVRGLQGVRSFEREGLGWKAVLMEICEG